MSNSPAMRLFVALVVLVVAGATFLFAPVKPAPKEKDPTLEPRVEVTTGWPVQVLFTPDGSKLLCTLTTRKVLMWNVQTEELLWSAKSDLAAAFFKDNERVAIAHPDLKIVVTHISDLQHMLRRAYFQDEVPIIFLTPDERKCVALGKSGPDRGIHLKIWDARTAALDATVTTEFQGRVISEAVCAVDESALMMIQDTLKSDGHFLGKVNLSTQQTEVVAEFPPLTAVAFLPGGKRLVGATGTDGQLDSYDSADPSKHQLIGRHSHVVQALAISADGTKLVSVGGNQIKVWKLNPPQLAWERSIPLSELRVSVSPDGKLIAVAGVTYHGMDKVPGPDIPSFFLFDAESGKQIAELSAK